MKVIIVGGGQIGSYIASLLLANDHEVYLIENREKVYHMLEKEFPTEMLFFGNGSDPDLLERVGIASADVVAAVTGSDEVNLVISTLAKMEFTVPRVVARVNNPKNTWLFNKGMGVDVCVNQADIIAHLVIEEMDIKDMFTLLKLTKGDYSIIRMKVGASARAVNQQLKDLSIPQKTVLIAITRDESLLIPKGDTMILAEDEILLLTDECSRQKLKEIFA